MRVEDLAAEQGIPPNYLVQILIELKSQQIVKSVRGKEGGYLLARAPAEITMADVLRCVHGQVFDSPALERRPMPARIARRMENTCKPQLTRPPKPSHFQKLLDQSADKEKMYYISAG